MSKSMKVWQNTKSFSPSDNDLHSTQGCATYLNRLLAGSNQLCWIRAVWWHELTESKEKSSSVNSWSAKTKIWKWLVQWQTMNDCKRTPIISLNTLHVCDIDFAVCANNLIGERRCYFLFIIFKFVIRWVSQLYAVRYLLGACRAQDSTGRPFLWCFFFF